VFLQSEVVRRAGSLRRVVPAGGQQNVVATIRATEGERDRGIKRELLEEHLADLRVCIHYNSTVFA